MRIPTAAVASMVVLACAAGAAQTTAPQPPGPRFEAVSIKRNTSGTLGATINERPDGGFTMTNIPVTTLIGRAWLVGVPLDWVGMPDWAVKEYYDVSATSSLQRATDDDRRAMLRAMLAERFNLVVHTEQREHDVYDLVLARADRRLGPGLKKAEEDVDCEARAADERAKREAALAAGQPRLARPVPDFNAPPPPCTTLTKGTLTLAQNTLTAFAFFLRGATGRPIVDKTGLKGTYYITLEFDRMARLRGPEVTPSPDGPPSVFTAVQEQLGLKLEPSRAVAETLVIDRLERPTEN